MGGTGEFPRQLSLAACEARGGNGWRLSSAKIAGVGTSAPGVSEPSVGCWPQTSTDRAEPAACSRYSGTRSVRPTPARGTPARGTSVRPTPVRPTPVLPTARPAACGAVRPGPRPAGSGPGPVEESSLWTALRAAQEWAGPDTPSAVGRAWRAVRLALAYEVAAGLRARATAGAVG